MTATSTRAMTDKKALIEARKRFGKTALIKKSKTPSMERLKKLNPNSPNWLKRYERYAGKNRYVVGLVIYGFAFEVRGEGLSWEEAFKNVDAKEGKKIAA